MNLTFSFSESAFSSAAGIMPSSSVSTSTKRGW